MTKPIGEKIISVAIDQIQPFPNHPFQVNEDEALERLKESIAENGVLTPAVVRPKEDGTFEMISGHRRLAACKALGLQKMPVIVREVDDDTATVMMVDANRQRESLLPSEKAFAYKMRVEALKHRGQAVVGMAQETGENYKQVQRYVRLTRLIPPLLQMVDDGKMGLIPAVELSYLPTKEQEMVLSAIESEQCVPSLAQAKQLRQQYADEEFTDETPIRIFSANKGKAAEKLSLPMDRLAKYFAKDATPKQMLDVIIELLEQRERKRQHARQQER